jgi:hypothetical protein
LSDRGVEWLLAKPDTTSLATRDDQEVGGYRLRAARPEPSP